MGSKETINLFSGHDVQDILTCANYLAMQVRLQRWSIFRAMRCRWFIFQQRCDTDYFLERLNIAIVAIIFLDHRERLFFDYFAHFEDRLFCDYSRSAPQFPPKRAPYVIIYPDKSIISTQRSLVKM